MPTTVLTHLADQIDALLPQTQCTQCGFSGCRPYAEAIAEGKADINQCPPGGEAGIRRLANLLGADFKPLNPAHGIHKPKAVAFIDENLCIGCTLCIRACPVDAIVGATKQMHTIIAAECTGCELCLPPCPVDCIAMIPVPVPLDSQKCSRPGDPDDESVAKEAADRARVRYAFRNFRIERDKQERLEKLARPTSAPPSPGTALKKATAEDKKAAIQAALERARAKRARFNARHNPASGKEEK